MRLPTLWSSNDPFRALQREMDDVFRSFGRQFPTAGAGGMDMRVPAMNVSETDNAIEVTAELPGVDDKDLKVSIDGNRLYISGEKKQEREDKEKDWHVVERSFGSFQRSLTLPFEPQEEAVDAHFDKGVLHLTVKKPQQMPKGSKTINVRSGGQPAQISGTAQEVQGSQGPSGAAGSPNPQGGSNENQERKAG